MSERDDSVYLRHIQDSIHRIESYLEGVEEPDFRSTPLLQDGVARRLEIIGEATKALSEETRSGQPDVPWREIAGMRDKLINEYFGVDLGTVWVTATEDIPQLKPAVREILEASGAE